MKKRILSLILSAVMLSLSSINSTAQMPMPNGGQVEDPKLANAVVLFVGSPNALVNNKMTKIDSASESVKPVIIDGRTLIPARFISESFGATVDYYDETKTVTVKNNDLFIKLIIDDNTIIVNDTPKTLDVPAQIIGERTFIPLRAMSEMLGKKLFWDDKGLIVISDTDNIFDASEIDDIIAKLGNKEGTDNQPSVMGQVVSVAGNSIIIKASDLGAGGGVPPQASDEKSDENITLTIPDGMIIKNESHPGDENGDEVKLSDIKPGMFMAVWYSDEASKSISKIRVSQSAGGHSSGMDASSITNKWLDVPYATTSKNQTLDIYLPNTGNGPFPVIFAIHGGAFKMGSSKGGDVAPMFEGVNRGYAVVSVNYRLSSEAKFPAAVSDVKAAIRFIKANADKYKLDEHRIAVWGDSAGGNLASMIGTTGKVDSLDGDISDNANLRSNVFAVVDWFGPLDFLKMDEQFKASGVKRVTGDTSTNESPESAYIGQLITQDTELTQKANPETYISTLTAETSPSFFIQHGTDDGNVPMQQSVDFAKLLKDKIGEDKVTLDILQGAKHGTSEFSTKENLDKVFNFLDKVLNDTSKNSHGGTGGQGTSQLAPSYDWVDPKTTPEGGTEYKLYDTPTRGAGTQGSYLIYLPESYTSNTTKRYPVIYWLHGGFGYQGEGAGTSLNGFISSMKAGTMPECIIVYPQALPSGWYCNSKDGARPVEDVLIKDLIPAIDKSYRTIASSSGRGIEGMSMGGFGALHLGLKYTNVFSAISAVGPSINPSLADEPAIRTQDTFFDDNDYYKSCSPQGIVESKAGEIKSAKPFIRILGGTADGLRGTILNFDKQLTTAGISHIFAEADGAGHDYSDIISKINVNPYEFWKLAFTNKN